MHLLKQHIIELISRLGEGKTTPVPYGAAWVARIPSLEDLTKPAYPETLTWLRDHQLEDGSWGTIKPIFAHGNTINTLATILALKHWNMPCDQARIEHGIKILWKLAEELPHEMHESIGFELLLPTLYEEAKSYGFNLPYEVYQHYSIVTAEKKKLILTHIKKYGSQQPASWWYNLEMLGNISFINDNESMLAKHLLSPNGSVASSTSATAYLLAHMRAKGIDLPEANTCLQKLITINKGGVPYLVSIDGFEVAFGLEFFAKAGLLLTDPLFSPALRYLHQHFNQQKGIGYYSGFIPDVDDTAIAIAVLRSAHYPVSIKPLMQFFNGSYMRTFLEERTPSVSANINTLTTLRLFEGDPEANKMIQSVAAWLEATASSEDPAFFDKWHFSPYYPVTRSIFALYGLNDVLVTRCINWILKQQNQDGGWGAFSQSTREETAYVILALCFWYRHGHAIPRQVLEKAQTFLIDTALSSEHPPLWIGKVLYCPPTVVACATLAAQYALQQAIGD